MVGRAAGAMFKCSQSIAHNLDSRPKLPGATRKNEIYLEEVPRDEEDIESRFLTARSLREARRAAVFLRSGRCRRRADDPRKEGARAWGLAG